MNSIENVATSYEKALEADVFLSFTRVESDGKSLALLSLIE